MATTVITEFDGTDGNVANLTSEPDFFNVSAPNQWHYETSSKASGTASVVADNPAGSTSVWTYAHPALVTTHYYDTCYKVTTLPAGEVIIGQIRSGGTNRAQITLQADGSVRIKNGTTAVDSTAAGFAVAGQWLRWKWGITGGTQELRLYKDANPANLFGPGPTDVLTGNMSQGSWDQYRIGMMSAEAIEVWVDRVVIDNSTWPTGGSSGNQAPVANAGPDNDSYIGGSLVTLDGSGSADADGTIEAYLWSQVSGPTVTLSSTTVANPTFIAPSNDGSATFQLRVTDNQGTQSTPDNVVITWSAAPSGTPTSDFYDLLLGGAVSASLTATPGGNTGFDTVDSGWTFATPFAGSGLGAAQVTANGAVKILAHVNPGGLVSSLYLDAVFEISNLAAGPWFIMRALDGSTIRATVRVNTNGSIQCRNGLTAVGTETSTQVVAGEPFRVAWHANNGGTQTARLYTGANLFGSTGADTTSGNFNSGTFDRVGFGIAAPATASGSIKVAIPQVDGTTWPEPFGASTLGSVASGLYLIEAGPTYTPVLFDLL